MAYDYTRLISEEMKDMSLFLRGLAPEQWDAPTLCEGWRVRDVVGHICAGYSTPLVQLPANLFRYGFSPPRVSHRLAILFGSSHTPAQILEVFDGIAATGRATGLARIPRDRERFTDHLIHHQDIRRPFGARRQIPEERLLAALDSLPKVGGTTNWKKNTVGLRFQATDVPWSWGEGPAVSGPAESIVMAVSGRQLALDELEGDGLSLLADKLKA